MRTCTHTERERESSKGGREGREWFGLVVVLAMSNQVAKALSEYQTARAAFLESVRCLVAKEDGGRVKESLFDADVVGLLCRPLIQDVVPSIQIASLGTLSRVAQKSEEPSSLTKPAILDSIVASLAHQSRRVRLQANGALQSISGRGAECAAAVHEAGALMPLLLQLEDTDDELNRTAVRTINTLTRSSHVLAMDILAPDDARPTAALLPLLVGHLNTGSTVETADALKASIVALLADACATGEELTSRVVAAGGLESVCRLVVRGRYASPALLEGAFRCLQHIASYTDELAALIVAAGVVPHAARALTHSIAFIRRSAARLAYELSSKTREMATCVAEDGVVCLVQALSLCEDEPADEAVPGVLALGHMAAFSERLAKMVAEASGAEALVRVLSRGGEHAPAAASWAITQLARHGGSETGLAIARASALPALMGVYAPTAVVLAGMGDDADDDTVPAPLRDLHAKSLEALQTCIAVCPESAALEPLLLPSSGAEVLAAVAKRLAQLLVESVEAKRTFITSGGLMRLQTIARHYTPDEGARASRHDDDDADAVNALSLEGMLMEDVGKINAIFPQQVVAYYHADHQAS